MTPTLIWFRQDLRLTDNPALHAAQGRPVLACYIMDDAAAGAWAHGAAQRWWLHHSLAALRGALAARGVALHLAVGRAEALVPQVAAAIGATEVHAGRLYEPWARPRDAAVAAALEAAGRRLVLHSSSLLHEPHRIRTGQGKPYSVYTPFSRALFAQPEPAAPLPVPDALSAIPNAPAGLELDALALMPERGWWQEFPAHWTPGEAGAQARLGQFTARALAGYDEARNTPGLAGTSGLSPHLRFGEISPRQIWHAARAAGAAGDATFLKEILWREFSYHLLWHRTELPEAPLQASFAAFPWQADASFLRAWQRGQTGYPIVDAGMRQLWRTGWMHNRVRMIAGSLLVKHLLQPWQQGAAWFWDTLLDGDLASNSASWQWVAGCGADAAPYFRVFNPTLQGEKFDAGGAYVRRWVPELDRMPDKYLHKPWEAPDLVLRGAGVRLGQDYPRPVVEHAAGRARALAAYATLRAETPRA